MPTPPELSRAEAQRQYAAAEEHLRRAQDAQSTDATLHVARAQVCATLALVAATAAAQPPVPFSSSRPRDFTTSTPEPDVPKLGPFDAIDPHAFDDDPAGPGSPFDR
ncbi:hypothetical protein [Actinomycetospora termitidis]|uniref:Uncharacterized protein n=1 Tax=Actinomycetospora termitidis TaxID=3053470 RepID=A0ABT7ME39_9PSEU|nr:hypothetical protein [Actinomycetospora sp. Odt1-22]MDL5158931.1 hypothetical protein [Actinomycetospora sp. Odt1-22]